MIQDIIGLILRPINYLIPVKKKHWVFGADYGNMYREGSKYLLEYMLKEHPDYNCTFITRNKEVIKELKAKGIPVEHNYSWKGIYKCTIADVVFTTQVIGDIYFTYKKRNRLYLYLLHGQPFKCAAHMLPQSYFESIKNPNGLWLKSIFNKFKRWAGLYWGVGYKFRDVSFLSATSEFTASLLSKEHEKCIKIEILGMPRNDALFQKERMKSEHWISGIEGKRIITYMPTHRKYGKGELAPIPFLNNPQAQIWMRENNIVLLIKQHPNMIKKTPEIVKSDVIIDISRERLDPQVVIYHSDVLITDYSSVWMDYLLLRRPLLFYFYDDFETEDAGCYYNLRNEFPHNYCEKELDLFGKIQMATKNPEKLTPTFKEVSKFHKYLDGNSCQRYYDEIINRKTY